MNYEQTVVIYQEDTGGFTEFAYSLPNSIDLDYMGLRDLLLYYLLLDYKDNIEVWDSKLKANFFVNVLRHPSRLLLLACIHERTKDMIKRKTKYVTNYLEMEITEKAEIEKRTMQGDVVII